MNLKRKLAAAAVVPLLSGAAIAATADSAAAITRVGCTSYQFLWIHSNQTTCWANAGGVPVTLYGTTGADGGNNAGFVRFSSGSTRSFAKGTSNGPRWSPATVNYVAIY